ncbi:type II secretion system F family protein [Nocardioides sp. URHA0020]|uniref:type II secretion system F family protein n=1 Tax=Nocardioides sp. URHA0020 TaxID=1380392 RepID=UPI00048F8230|nr:type II secretion system F family protein [Nocardioides sp. URHA0020]
MILLFVLGVGLVGVALALVSVALRPGVQPGGVARSIAVLESITSPAPVELTREVDPPFGERIIEPLRRRALAVGRRLTGADSSDRIRHKLDLAGNPAGWTVDRVVSAKVLCTAVAFTVALAASLVLGTSPTTRIALLAIGAAVGWFGPNLYLYQRTYERTEQMQRELPDSIDLLTICVESGLGFDAAIQQVARRTEGPLADEFNRMLHEMQIGMGRGDALRALSERSNVVDVRSFVGAMAQADSFGIPIAQVLRTQSHEMRVRRRQRAEQRAQQVPVKITVPLIFCILPCLFIAVMGPAAISIMASF